MLNAMLGTVLNERFWAVGAGWFGSGAGRGESRSGVRVDEGEWFETETGEV